MPGMGMKRKGFGLEGVAGRLARGISDRLTVLRGVGVVLTNSGAIAVGERLRAPRVLHAEATMVGKDQKACAVVCLAHEACLFVGLGWRET